MVEFGTSTNKQSARQEPTMRNPRKIIAQLLAFTALAWILATAPSCGTAPKTTADRRVLSTDTTAFIARAKETDPSLTKFFDNCVGYAVLPDIGKGGLILGGAYGKGQLFDRSGRMVGYCDVSQGSIGAQIGGQSFGEMVFFENEKTFSDFKGGKFSLTAQASAVALSAGAAAAAKYDNGIALFVMNPKGLMLEASVGGQQFGYQALADVYEDRLDNE
jgi:lipid-binding SYLF domain-containing protein